MPAEFKTTRPDDLNLKYIRPFRESAFRKISVSSILLIGITACTDSSINLVKNGSLEFNDQFTISQAFDNRDICQSTEWSNIVDDRERETIVYKCNISSIDSYLSGTLTKRINLAKEPIRHNEMQVQEHKATVLKLESDISSLEEAIAKEKSSQRTALLNATYENIINSIKLCNADLTDYEGSTEFPSSCLSMTDYYYKEETQEVLTVNGKRPDLSITSFKDTVDKIDRHKKAIENGRSEYVILGFKRGVSDAIYREKQYLKLAFRATTDSVRNNQHYTSQAPNLNGLKFDLEDELRDLGHYEERLKESRDNLQSLENVYTRYESAAQKAFAQQIFEWVIFDNQNFELTRGGIYYFDEISGVKSRYYSDYQLDRALGQVYKNDITKPHQIPLGKIININIPN